MSFQSVDAPSEGPKSKLGRQWRDDESQFERIIKENVQQMQESLRRAEEILQVASRSFLAKAMDVKLTDDLRKCERLEQETERTFRDWTVHMAGEPLERHRKRFAFDKLRKAFDEEISCFKTLLRRVPAARHQSSKHVERDEEIGIYEPLDMEPSPKHSTQITVGDSLMNRHEDTTNMYGDLAGEREEGIKRIQSQMASVNQIFRDLASIVTEQGRQMETIEQQADESCMNTQQATEELKKASRRPDSTGHLWFIILMVTLFVVFSILTHSFSATPAAAGGAVVIGDGRGVGLVGVDATKVSGYATGFGTRITG